eukprot:scaffold18606_cov78-Skeletonema_dohrnii-CCMP3373.AAC.1
MANYNGSLEAVDCHIQSVRNDMVLESSAAAILFRSHQDQSTQMRRRNSCNQTRGLFLLGSVNAKVQCLTPADTNECPFQIVPVDLLDLNLAV